VAELVSLLESVGFAEVRITERFNCFRGTSKEHVARKFGVHGVNVFARKADTPMDWHQHWEAVYRRRRPGEVSWYQENPARSHELIRRTGISLAAPIIDVGGGASRLVDYLLTDGFTDITVLDVSVAALRQARERLGPAAEQISWIEANITTFVPPRRYHVWHDRAVFHFLTHLQDRQRYVDVLRAALAPHGHAVIATFGLGGPERCSGLPVQRYTPASLAAELGAGLTLMAEEQESHVTPAGAVQLFQYCWFRADA
jgi:SAM-dependent methyltransferase